MFRGNKMQDILNENLVYQNKNGIEYMQFKKLLQYPEITHCYTLKSNNQLNFPPVYKDEKKLKQSYEKIAIALGIDANTIIKPHQTHTDRVEIVKWTSKFNHKKIFTSIETQQTISIDKIAQNERQHGDSKPQFNEVDGLLTSQKGITLCTTSADCISLLFYDPVKKVIGSVHSGWKGTLQGISKKAIEKMVQEYQSNPEDIICCICPSIRKCCFEVDEDVKELFWRKYKNLPNIEEIIEKRKMIEGKQKYHIDTVKINQKLLKKEGLKQENIIDSGICTMCHPKYFHSYRADKENSGRNAAIISLVD